MSGKPKNFSQALHDLEDQPESNGRSQADDFRQIEEMLANLRPHLEGLSALVSDEGKKAKARVEGEVHKHPWAAVGIAGLVFFLLGFLFASKTSRRND